MDKRIQIRPIIECKLADSPIENFQNQTIRPIVKLQHHLIQAVFIEFYTSNKIVWNNLSDTKKTELINNSFEKDLRFKNSILHLIIGHFMIDEYNFFKENKKELSKRIYQITKTRVLSIYGY